MSAAFRVVLLPNANGLAHTSRCLAIAHAMRRLGPQVQILCAGSGPAMDLARGLNIEVVPIRENDHARLLAGVRSTGLPDFGDGDALRQQLADQEALIQEVSPDVIVSDWNPTARLAALRCTVAHVAVSNTVLTPARAIPFTRIRPRALFDRTANALEQRVISRSARK